MNAHTMGLKMTLVFLRPVNTEVEMRFPRRKKDFIEFMVEKAKDFLIINTDYLIELSELFFLNPLLYL